MATKTTGRSLLDARRSVEGVGPAPAHTDGMPSLRKRLPSSCLGKDAAGGRTREKSEGAVVVSWCRRTAGQTERRP